MSNVDIIPILMIIVFVTGYLLIVFEHALDINKATSALMMGVLSWALLFSNSQIGDSHGCLPQLCEDLSSVSQVIFFLLGAMIIVEIISAHKGFSIITDNIQVQSKRKFLWIVGLISFFLSSILDNLTTTIVMVSIIQKMIDDPKDKLILGGGIVIAANAGGVWTPIGDVTTTMLWIGGQISTFKTMTQLFIPSFTCFAVSFAMLTFMLKGNFPKKIQKSKSSKEPLGMVVFFLGIGTLMFVPIFKLLTGLPPFLGVIFGLSVMWFFTDIAHRRGTNRDYLKVTSILPKIDISGPLFFLGILLAVGALETAGLLTQLAGLIDYYIASPVITVALIGIASAVVDNIPLVGGSMGMYDLTQYPMDDRFWQLMAYCAGTGGSLLIIGSAAGVMYMSIEKVDFISYMKKITLPALAGYFAGIFVYLLF